LKQKEEVVEEEVVVVVEEEEEKDDHEEDEPATTSTAAAANTAPTQSRNLHASYISIIENDIEEKFEKKVNHIKYGIDKTNLPLKRVIKSILQL
jgi:hypothetical protein